MESQQVEPEVNSIPWHKVQKTRYTRELDFEKPIGLVSYSTEVFRALALSKLTENDFVIEIGCSFGVCTKLIAEKVTNKK